MTDDIESVLTQLRSDHKNMVALLKRLETEADRLYADAEPDFEMMHDIMLYMTEFPDAVHHPKENRLYALLKTSRPDLTAGFERISLDHRTIAAMGLSLKDQIASVTSESMVRRNALVSDCLRYVNTQRSHMQWEEIDLFRRCRQLCADGKTLTVADADDPTDPLFGRTVERRFQRLYSALARAL
ncbi:MAG: hemerythrin domain-containing protein [Pseudomonadota bacterium]